MKDSTPIISRKSASQESRFLSALDFDYVKIDERSFKDLLLFAVGFSKLIYFYNSENQIEGDWCDFLMDELVVLANITDIDPAQIEERFKDYSEKSLFFKRPEKKIFYLKKCFDEIHNVAQILDIWFVQFKYIEQFANIQLTARDEVFNAITNKLSSALIKLKAFDENAETYLGQKIGLDYTNFDGSWDLHKSKDLVYRYEGETLSDKIKYIQYDLRPIFQSFYETLIYLKNKAHSYLSESLKNDTHYPEVALFVGFLRLFELLQNNINDLSRRYLEFYYQKVLRQTTKLPTHDKVYLQFTTTENALFVEIPEGHPFIGGEYENGENIIYKADSALLVNKAKILKIYTVYLDNRLLQIRTQSKKLITNILSAEIDQKRITPDKNKQEKKAFATFGENQAYKSIHEKTMKDASVGFAIASPIFFMSEGSREVILTLEFSEDSFKSLVQYIKDLSFLTGDGENEVFIKSFLDAFNIFITTENGWHAITKYVVNHRAKGGENEEEELESGRERIDKDKRKIQGISKELEDDAENKKLSKSSCLRISFDLENNEPAWIAYQKSIHQGNYQTHLPLVKVILNNNSYIYPYTLLSGLVLEKVAIITKAKEVKTLNLQSPIGEISPDNPFFPFGSVPTVGSFLLIGKNEIFQKSLNFLHINIEWYNLPLNKDGFQGYYADYDADLDNTSFEIRLSILDGGRWKPQNVQEQQMFKLFRTKTFNNPDEPLPAAQLSEYSVLKVNSENISAIKLPANYSSIQENLKYNNTIQRGFIKLELCNPPESFGNTLYPSVLSEIVMENSKSGILKRKEARPLPNQPYIPQIKSISLDYGASSVISLNDRSIKNDKAAMRGQFFHIYPFGETLVYPDNSKQVTYLLPELKYEGAMLIGLKDLFLPQTVSFLFEMADGFTVTSEEEPPVIEWSYLANNEWEALSESKVLKDETNKFIKTGIITLELPQEMQKGNSILDPELYWLRVAVIQNIQTVSQTIHITTQVLTATLQSIDEKGEHLKQPLKAFTIERAVSNISGIQTITQTLPSFSGLPAESSKAFYTRISERLRHKQRAVTTWDYERLVLEKFPQIAKVTCLPNMTSRKLHSPGSVLLVVVPQAKTNDLQNLELKASSEQLYQIKNYLHQYTSPFVKLEVRNPSYERVKIICSVKLADGYNFGFYVQKLNDEINQYLIGDMIANSKSIELGGKINSSDILSFMRTLKYVEFITQFSMVQIAQDFTGKFVLLDTAKEENTKSFLQATKPWSILIPSNEHQITTLNSKEEIKSNQAGFGNLELGNNFVVNSE